MQTKGFSTEDIMRIALDLIDEKDIPQDSGIHVRGEGIRRLLFTMDANVGLIHMASDLEFDCVLCHHPAERLSTRERSTGSTLISWNFTAFPGRGPWRR